MVVSTTVTITINGAPHTVEAGRPLVEVIKEAGIYISNLCYLDGLPAYAGCRTCVVEVEGMRGLPLACSTPVTDGMVVRTDTEATLEMRQEVMAFILANHSDRCLTCHRVDHCRTGDICLRDNVVTHRCVTCSKNYRCELQTASDVADMGRANVEPYLDEARTFYQFQQPPPDRGNPFFEFDPQMCILCTRCERACADLRHTTAITLAGRGFSTRMAFGAGGAIDESNCDFCGACVDVCPTATLMEAPNKWVARPEQWVGTVCTECSMGCTIQIGVRDGRGVIVRPAEGNDVSRDQICVRGRFGYDQVRDRQRLHTGRLGRGQDAFDAETDVVLRDASRKLAAIIAQHGPLAVGLLGSGQTTVEENYALAQLAAWIGTPHIDASVGSVWGAVETALRESFGSVHLPNQLTSVESAGAVVAIGDDLSASNNVLGVRIKGAVAKGATLVSVSARHNPIDDHATAALGPLDGDLAATVQALATSLLARDSVRDRLPAGADDDGNATPFPGLTDATVHTEAPKSSGACAAAELLAARMDGPVAIVVAPSRHSAAAAGAQVRAAANLAIALAGPDAAPASLHVLPPENNTIGLRDAGVVPGASDGQSGLSVDGMLAAARDGTLKALVVLKDNPLLTLPDRAFVQAALEALDLLLVIDEVATDTVQTATHVLADVSTFAKSGTVTNADRQMLRLRAAYRPQRGAQPALSHLRDLGSSLATAMDRESPDLPESPALAMDALAASDARYASATMSRLLSATRQPPNGAISQAIVPVAALSAAGDGLLLLSGRDLYTDRTSAALRADDADRLHRAESADLHPTDAAALGITDGESVALTRAGERLLISARVSEDVAPGCVFVPLLYDGGAVQALLPADGSIARVAVERA
ncbi:MAG: putative molibdopterin-dependent oxidoreductase YjgC [Chloroflexi bacterium]|nr:MAG: putative molibdopterin-dependent oxidoreductase YjgC [Chloroflexota bacterium]